MKGVLSIFWKFTAFSLIMQWTNVGLADVSATTPSLEDANVSPAAPHDFPWKLPKAIANWRLPDSVQIHGFASQSYIFTSGNEFFGHSTNTGSLDFTEMGINGSWRPLSQLQTSLQIVYRRAGRTDNSDLRIDFGFLDYSFISDVDTLIGVRMGRVVTPLGIYNDTRDMPFTRPSIFLPQSIYFDVNRNFALSGDGVQFYGEYRSKIGDFFLHANGFYPRTNDPDLKDTISGSLPGYMREEPSWVTRLIYEWGAGKIRLGVTGGQFNAKYVPEGGENNYEPGAFRFSPILFSAQYNAENWSLTSEYAIRSSSLNHFGPRLPDTTIHGESYYVQGSYRFIESLEWFLRYDALYWDKSDRSGKELADATGLSAHRQFAKDITTGIRWDISPSFMARLEYHYINGTGWISHLENIDSEASQHWSMFAMSVSFRF
ncbi:MAG: hypothetical protein ACKN9T_13240 [Candidatus Methylumidiphilus sp.]